MTPTSRRASIGAGALAAALLVALVVAFGVRWSRSCEEERAAARGAWARYAAHADAGRAERAERVIALLGADRQADLEAVVEAADTVGVAPEPSDAAGARLYREAQERLSLASGACFDQR